MSNPRDSSRKFGAAFLHDNQSLVLIQKDYRLEDVRKNVISEKITPTSEPAGKSTSAIHTGPVVEPKGDNDNVELISMKKPTPALWLSDQTGAGESDEDGTFNMTANSSIVKPSPASDLSNSRGKYESGSCDLYHGKWANGSMIHWAHCTQTVHALLLLRCKIVKAMGDPTKNMRTGDGNPLSVIFFTLMLKVFWN